MTQAHHDELTQQLGDRGPYWIPDEQVKAMPDKWVSLKDNLLHLPCDEVPPAEAVTVLEHKGHLYVLGRTEYAAFAIKYGERREGMPDADALINDYVEEVGDLENLGGCLHHLCELSFGFSTTHHSYTGNEPDRLLERIGYIHGKNAAGTLQTACDAIGYSSITGMEDFCSQELVRNLLQIAQVQSDYHRGYRV